MNTKTEDLLAVLSDYGIAPEDMEMNDLPEVGEIEEGEKVYTTPIANVLPTEEQELGLPTLDQPHLRGWLKEFEKSFNRRLRPENDEQLAGSRPACEPHCAWYCPIHFFGHGWGIYIRESCLLATGLEIARTVNWSAYRGSYATAMGEVLRSAFYVFFLHEQFHHKVESLGFRFLVSTASDRYRPYKRSVYRANYGKATCLEESLANAESYRRLAEPRYSKKVSAPVWHGLRTYLKTTMPLQPPGYAQGPYYFTDRRYREGISRLHSQILDGRTKPMTPPLHWRAAPNMITALADISAEIYVLVPSGVRPIFSPSKIDPGYTASTKQIMSALTKHYGYTEVQGGKGSHVKLEHPGKAPIVLPGNKPVLSPGVVKYVLRTLGRHPMSKLPDLLNGQL